MNDVLEKLQRVKIQNKTRLSKEDQQFCQIQQKLYDSTRNHFLSMFVDMETLHQQELTFYGKVQKYADRVYKQNLICMDKKKQIELMEKVHNHFIRTIISFFNRKYGLAIQKHSYERYISLQDSAEPVLHKRISSLTEEEKQIYREERKKCCKQKEENLHEVLFARIEYPLILDDIFSYLGGFSFQEKVEQEIKTDAKAGVTYAKYKLQSKKLSIQNLLCSKTDLWGEYEICLDSEKYKALLRALTFFDSSKEQVSIYDGWLERFVSFSYSGKKEKEGIFDEHPALGKKVVKFKYFKNGRYTTELEVLKRPQEIYQTYVLPVLQERRKNAANIYFECQNTDLEAKQKQVFQEKTVKLLFDIKRNRNIAHKAGLAEAILQKYLKQTKPEELSWQEWEKIKIQPEDVLRKLKGILSSANKTYRNEIRIVKTTYGFKEKDYRENGTDMNLGSINSFVLSKREVPGFEQFLKKKRREFALQETSFEKMKQDDKIAEYLENWHVTSQMTGEVKYLNAVQKKEVNKLLQKRYVALQFSMGTGKSLCTLAMAQYRMKYNSVRNIFIVGTALAINNTWEEILEDYQIDFYRIRKREDIKRVQRGQIVLLTINLLTELKREMKKLLRIRCQKVMLIFDESDAITNGSSKRTKAMLSVFRKCRYG